VVLLQADFVEFSFPTNRKLQNLPDVTRKQVGFTA
jgi:hypothetical protein